MEALDIDQLMLLPGGVGWHTERGWQDAAEADLIWVLSLGKQENFLDKVQLLQLAARTTTVINSPYALAFWHAKYLPTQIDIAGLKIPETLASRDKNQLWEQILKRGGDWVVKPPGGRGGENVCKLNTADKAAFYRLPDHFHLVQRYIPSVSQGEKRVLLAGTNVIGQYLRVATDDFRTNLSQGGLPKLCSLNAAEQKAMRQLGALLLQQGIVFSGVDLCWPWLIEINIVSPGGLDTISALSGRDLSDTVLTTITSTLDNMTGKWAVKDSNLRPSG